MMAIGKNRFIDFLSHYGPIPSGNNMYDELIQEELKAFGIDQPIAIPPVRLRELADNFSSAQPLSIILTGTAGDGKTYHCRLIWKQFGGDPSEWEEGKKSVTLKLENSAKRLTIIKDLSELTSGEKTTLLSGLAESIAVGDSEDVYLIAANDGQLVASLREWAGQKGDDASRSTFKAIEGMLVDDAAENRQLPNLRMYNLSRIDVSCQFEQLVEQIVEHPGWEGCQGCAYGDENSDRPCPIRINRSRLRGAGDSQAFRKRLSQLLRLATANRTHLPIRDLLLLIVNILLGDHEPNQALLTCRKAKNRADSERYDLTNPYSHVFGGNLRDKERQKYQAFNVLAGFGIGKETDNEFDNLLIYGPYSDPEQHEELIGKDRFYGGASYRRLLEDYLEGDRNHESEFMAALERQRQRLFFTLPAVSVLDAWKLTAYRHAGKLLELFEASRTGREATRLQESLAMGLNRSFTGMMFDEGRKLYFASSGGGGRGRIAVLLDHEVQVGKPSRPDLFLQFSFPDNSCALQLSVMDYDSTTSLGALSLELTHFEYLMRIAQGSLPSSFSRQCYEDFLDFKLRTIETLSAKYPEQSRESEVNLRALEVTEAGDGQVRNIRIEVNVP